MIAILSVLLFSGATLVNAACSATISSLSDVENAVTCTNIILNGFTVPAGYGLSLNLVEGTTVTMNGDILFGNVSWAGPLFTVRGTSITFNGSGYKFDGGGPFYWDGKGEDGIKKPDPMMKIEMSGTFTDVHVVNSPVRVYSVSNPAQLTMSNLVIDNSQGDAPNHLSGKHSAARNTDGFDVGGNDLIIRNSQIHSQDDCIAINKGANILFEDNKCTNGHGISIGSISSSATVCNVSISGNTITDSEQALRIKTKSAATGGTVTNITYAGNTATGIRQYGVIIDQSYPATLGSPGSGVIISGVNFIAPTTSITVNSEAKRVAVNCGAQSCKGTWDWSNLKVSGGSEGPINYSGIIGMKI